MYFMKDSVLHVSYDVRVFHDVKIVIVTSCLVNFVHINFTQWGHTISIFYQRIVSVLRVL